jgi:UDP-glucose 4-epimerase
MKVLVTGGAGFIGSNVVDKLINRDYEVAIIDDLSTGRLENLNERARFYKVDICSPELEGIFRKEMPEIVNHHAAQIDVRRSLDNPILDAQINIMGSLNLLGCCQKYGAKKVIYASTGGAIYGEPESLPASEDCSIKPLSPYGVNKYIVEKYLPLYRQNYNLDYTILRYGNVYGPRQDPHGEAGVVAMFIEGMLRGKRPIVFGDGEQTRDFVYVDDVVNANLFVLDDGDGGIFNIGTGHPTSVNELFKLLKEILKYNNQPLYGNERPGEIRNIYLDITRAQRNIGWRPEVGLEEGLVRTIRWLSERHI